MYSSPEPPRAQPATPNPLASLRERMHRGCAATGRSQREFLLAELEQARRLQATHSMPVIEAGQGIEAAALALLKELGLA